MAIAPRCAVSNTSTGTSTSPALTGWTNCALGFTGTAPVAGDLVFAVGWVAAASQTVSQTAGTGTWTFRDTGSNNTGNVLTTFCAYRVWTGAETAPTFTWSSSVGFGTILMAVAPDAGQVISVDVWATNKVDTVAATTHTANAATASGAAELSLILAAAVSSANGTSPMTSSSPASYSEPSGAGTSTTGTAGTPGYRADAWYRQSLSGTVTPGSATIEGGSSSVGTTFANLYHALVAEAQPVRPVARPVYAPGWHPGNLPGQPGGTPFQVPPSAPLAVAAAAPTTGPPVYPLGHPVQARALPGQGGRTASRDGVYGQAGPPVKPADGPVQARQLPARGGWVISRDGTFTAPGGGAPATVRSSSTYASAATEASFSMPLPSGFAAGDVCWLFVEDRAATGSLGAAPTGWTTVAATFHSGSSTSSEMAVYRKVMAGGEGNPTVTGTSGRFSAVCVAVQGADNTTPEDVATVEDGNGASSSTTITSPGVTPAGTNDLLLIGFGCGTPASGTAINYTTPAAMSLVASIATTVAAVTESGMMVASQALASNAATGTSATTITPSAVNGQTVTIGVRSAAGVAPQAGPPVYPLGRPVQARALPLRGGSADSRSGVYDQAGSPVKPLDTPVRAPVPQPSRGGRVTSRDGTFGRSGPPVRPLGAPVATEARGFPPRGRTTARTGTFGQAGAPVKPADGPVQARQLPQRGGRTVSRTGTFTAVALGSGPPVYPLGHPVQARRLPQRGGRVSSRAGTFTFVAIGAGAPVYPLHGPVQARRLPQRGGSTTHRAGTFGRLGPPVKPAPGPVQARQPLPPRGRTASRAGTFTAVVTGTGPPVYPLGHPVQARRQPAQGGRVVRRAGVYAQTGPPVRALRQPVGTGRQQPPPPARGRAASQRGPYGQTGPPVVRLRRPVRGQPAKPFLTGRAGWRAGTYTAPFVPPFTIGALTAADTAGSTLTAAGASNTLTGSTGPLAGITAATVPLNVLTAADAPGTALAGLLDQGGAPVTDESGAFILLEDGS